MKARARLPLGAASLARLAPLLIAGGLACTAELTPPGQTATPGAVASGGSPAMQPPPAPQSSERDVGTVAIHQVSAREYNNTVRDLLGTSLRPADGFQSYEAAGFDTLAAAGVMNSRKVTDYFAAASALADDAFADPARRSAIVTCEPAASGDTACATTVINAFGLRAFRRPLEAAELADLVVRYQEALAQKLDHAGALKHVVRVMLSSPQFIYRIELDADKTVAHPLSSYELASRLSYLLYSSMPDAALLSAAETNALQAPERLEQEVDRMLADPKSSELTDNFAAQWLGSRRLNDHVADPTAFPLWNDALRLAMQQEMGLYFDQFLHGDLPYDQFLTARVNYVDPGLAALYGLPSPGGTGLTRVTNDTGLRAGFLGLAGFLTHTSRADRSAPSIRGKWVVNSLECLELELPANLTPPPLGEPPPGQTVRQVLEQHRANPACAGCHNILDPVGLGLEHFDAVGRYRESYAGGLPVDAAGVLTDGTHVDGLVQLADALSKDPSFIACAAKKLFVYGVGRTVDGSQGELDEIVAGWQKRGLSLRNLLKELVINETFRSRHGN